MRVNGKALQQLAEKEAVMTGTLQYMKPQSNDWPEWNLKSAYEVRFCKLIDNVLFYYRTNGQDAPLGAFILEHMEVAYEACANSGPAFAFSLSYNDGKHIFSCRCQEDLNKWVTALKVASYNYWRSLHEVLRVKLARLKQGKCDKSPAANISLQSVENEKRLYSEESFTTSSLSLDKSTFYNESIQVSSSSRVKSKFVHVQTCSDNVPVDNLIDL